MVENQFWDLLLPAQQPMYIESPDDETPLQRQVQKIVEWSVHIEGPDSDLLLQRVSEAFVNDYELW